MFLHNFHPQSLIFSLGPINFYWYGFFISLGIAAGLFVTLKLARIQQIKSDLIWELSLWLLPAGLLGGRVYHILTNWPYYLNHPWQVFSLWQGGLAIYGAVFGGLFALFFFSQKNKISFWQLADILAPALALGQVIGRWGNYFNQELFGLPTNLPWGILIDEINRPLGFSDYSHFHPLFLYESILSFLIFLTLIKLCFLKFKGNKKIPRGNIFLTYSILYSLGRFGLEFIRAGEARFVFGLDFSQIISLLLAGGALVIILSRRANLRKQN